MLTVKVNHEPHSVEIPFMGPDPNPLEIGLLAQAPGVGPQIGSRDGPSYLLRLLGGSAARPAIRSADGAGCHAYQSDCASLPRPSAAAAHETHTRAAERSGRDDRRWPQLAVARERRNSHGMTAEAEATTVQAEVPPHGLLSGVLAVIRPQEWAHYRPATESAAAAALHDTAASHSRRRAAEQALD